VNIRLRLQEYCREKWNKLKEKAKADPLKTAVAVVLACLMLAAVVLTLYATFNSGAVETCALTECGRLTGGAALLPDGKRLVLTLPEEKRQAVVGERFICKPTFSPSDYAGSVRWTSSDSTVAQVDAEGLVTVCGEGNTLIIARSGGAWASMELTVSGTIASLAEGAIKQLAESTEPQDALKAARAAAARMALCTEQDDCRRQTLLCEITAFADGAGSEEALAAAVKETNADADRCFAAAMVCRSLHELSMPDTAALLTFTGDVTLCRCNEDGGKRRFPYIYQRSDSVTYPFDRIRALFACDTATVVNFEGTLTERTEHRDKAFYFRGDPSYAKILPLSSIEIANLENNHADDYFAEGRADTEKHLQAAGVSCLSQSSPLTIPAGEDGSVTLLAMQSIGGEQPSAEIIEQWVKQVAAAKGKDTAVVVNLHWGRESHSQPEQWQRETARRLIDAGAALVVGHHPHVLQPSEQYGGGYICYSLGNLAFGGNASVSSPQTMLLRVRFGRGEDGAMRVLSVSEVPCLTTSTGSSVNNYQPMPAAPFD